MKNTHLVLALIWIVSISAARVQAAPLQLSLTPEIALHDSGTFIEGLSLSIWGENPQRALALGVVNGSTGNSVGFSWALLLNYSQDYKGIQWGLVNYNSSDFLGWQAGTINYSSGTFTGLQTGTVNYAQSLKGVQLGLLNYSESVSGGLQVGIVNIIRETHTWFKEFPNAVAPAMVFVNWRF